MSRIVDSLKLLFLVSSILLCTSTFSFGADTMDPAEITEVVSEYETGGYLAQLGNYNVIVPMQIFVNSGSNAITPADSSSIKIGSVIKAELSGKDENGMWRASSFTIYEGAGLDEALQDLDEDATLRIKGSLKHIAEATSARSEEPESTTAAAQEPGESSSNSNSGVLRFENGVWKN